MKKVLSEIRQQLVPYYKAWDLLGDVDDECQLPKPDPPSDEIIDRLERFVDNHPEYEAGLEELLKVQLLTGHHDQGIETLKRLIELPVKRTPKKTHQLKTQLNNLEKRLKDRPNKSL